MPRRGNLFRPELKNHVLRPQRTDHWFTLTELLTGSERSWRSAFTQFHLSVSRSRVLAWPTLAHIAVRKSWDKIQKGTLNINEYRYRLYIYIYI